MANRHWPGENPIGRRLIIPSMGNAPREVVGVVADVKHSSLDTESGVEVYVPYLQKPFALMTVLVRTTSEPLQMTGAVRESILSVDSNQPIYGTKTMQQVVSDSMSQSRLYSSLTQLVPALNVQGNGGLIFGCYFLFITPPPSLFCISLGARPRARPHSSYDRRKGNVTHVDWNYHWSGGCLGSHAGYGDSPLRSRRERSSDICHRPGGACVGIPPLLLHTGATSLDDSV